MRLNALYALPKTRSLVAAGRVDPDCRARELFLSPKVTPALFKILGSICGPQAPSPLACKSRLLEEARRLRLTQLHLWTPFAAGPYARFGWHTVERLDYCGYAISVMKLAL